jgi:hypothetical protein
MNEQAKVKGVADATLKCAVITEVAGVQASALDPMKFVLFSVFIILSGLVFFNV